jgi:biofilm PGA synthesis N-glycosyltransferase PgaC
VIFSIYIIIILIQITYWTAFTVFTRKAASVKELPHLSLPPVSVIVCFKNEAHNLNPLLSFLTTQDYPNYEIVLVNDHSNDPFNPVIAAFKDSRIKLFHLPDSAHGKKKAQDYGINQAAHEIVCVTDADCTGSTQWIRKMVTPLIEKDICLGYAPLTYQRGTPSQFAIFESWIAAVQFISYAAAGMPYMGVGRNMAFKKKLFRDIGGHTAHLDLASGDDDLFVNAVANGSNTTIQLDQESFIWSPSKASWTSFLHQKSRHLTTSVRYQFRHQVLLSIFAISQMGFYLVPIISILFFPDTFLWIIITWACVSSLKYVFATRIDRLLPCRNLPVLFPLMDIMLAIYYMFMPLYMALKRNTSWK